MIGRTIFLLMTAGVAVTGHASTPSRYVLSFTGLRLAQGERVVGIDIHIANATVDQVTRAPAGWTLTIDNDPSGKVELRGNVLVGAAAMDVSGLNHLVRLVSPSDLGLGAPSVSGEIVVTSDFEHERHVPLDAKIVTLKPGK